MASKNEQAAEILDRYLDEVNSDPFSMDEVADWALSNKLFSPEPQDIKRMCRDALAAGARAQRRFDGKRWYRAKHTVKTNIGGVQLNLWADIDKNASRSFMEKSIHQRRRGVIGDCFQMKMDVDHYNEAKTEGVPIQVCLDFTDDVAELEAAKKFEDDAA